MSTQFWPEFNTGLVDVSGGQMVCQIALVTHWKFQMMSSHAFQCEKNIKFVRMIFLIRISETRGAVVRNSYKLEYVWSELYIFRFWIKLVRFLHFFLFRALIKQWDTKFLTRIDKEELKIITKLLPDILKKEDIIFIKAIYMTFNIYTL